MTKEFSLESVGENQKNPLKKLAPVMKFLLDPGIVHKGGVFYNPKNPNHTVTIVDRSATPHRDESELNQQG